MVHSDWFGYQRRFGASEWHQLFDASDGREKLTWRNRFAALPDGIIYVNFFSSGEDVLATYTGTQPSPSDLLDFEFSRNSWVLQEKWKGRPFGLAGSQYMGWGFNIADDQYNPYFEGPEGVSGRIRIDSDTANSTIKDNGQLIVRPFFINVATPGLESVLFTNNAIDYATLKPYINKLLVYALPALTTPTGGVEGGSITSDKRFLAINMNGKIGTWPRNTTEWWHSDIKNVGLPYVYSVIKELIIKGYLQ